MLRLCAIQKNRPESPKRQDHSADLEILGTRDVAVELAPRRVIFRIDSLQLTQQSGQAYRISQSEQLLTTSWSKNEIRSTLQCMDSSILGLNAAQQAAVTSPSSVIQILAPPGSGKTKTLTSRVAYLLSHCSYKPWNILCLTFTIKSAKEMKERIAKLIGNGMETRLVLGTFHSVCRRYLVSYGHLIGIRKGFGIADSSDSLSIIKRIVKRMGFKIDPMKARSRISSSKSKAISCVDIAQEGGKKKDQEQQEFHLVFEAYEMQLEASNLLDYDDLLLRCAELLEGHPDCVSNVEVVLIDEFQDTNLVQFDLMRLFAAKNKRVTTVGDPDQSIYGWRSAEVKNLKKMQALYPDTLIIHLEENYRSSAAIILSAREVIEQEYSRHVRPILPTHCPGTVPVLRRVPSAEAEASWVVSEIERCTVLSGDLLTYSDIAILVRSASLTRQIESALGRAGIPYRMVGGQRFFDRLEIKILLDYLRVVSQPKNNDALARIINVPPRGIGPTTVKTLLETAETSSDTLWYLIRSIVHGGTAPKIKLPKQAYNGLGALIHIVCSATKKLSDVNELHSPAMLLRYITKKLNFEEYLKKAHEQDYDTRWANVKELSAQASDYQITVIDPEARWATDTEALPDIEGLEQDQTSAAEDALSKFLANVALATEIQREDGSDDGEATPQRRVTISTMHAAKGLEWPVVFIPSAYEGSIPHSRAEDIDEERRLLYVAMTRAQALLYISCPTKNSQREDSNLSQFLSSKNVGHCFVNKGPTLDFSAVQDIARILRRNRPIEQALLESCSKAASLEDNKWPLDGSEPSNGAETRWNRWAATSTNQDYDDPPAKRRRVRGGCVQSFSTAHTASMGISSPVSLAIGTATTMQDPSAFSYAGGFTTAATQLRVIEAETPQRPKNARNKIDEPNDKQSPKKSQARKRLQGQGTLTNFFGKKPPGRSVSAPSIHDDLETVASYPSVRVEAIDPSNFDIPKSSTVASTLPEGTITRPGATAVTILPPPRKPLSSIPQSLAAHRLENNPTTRPRPPCNKNDLPTKDYVFLSSSPSQPASLPEPEAEAEAEDAKKIRTRHDNVIKPASTYYTTSMAQLQTSSNGAKRTLGVKRSMNGWAARGSKGFMIPRRVDGGG